jgi:hypothetical protein
MHPLSCKENIALVSTTIQYKWLLILIAQYYFLDLTYQDDSKVLRLVPASVTDSLMSRDFPPSKVTFSRLIYGSRF